MESTGDSDTTECRSCEGTGAGFLLRDWDADATVHFSSDDCRSCGGTGRCVADTEVSL